MIGQPEINQDNAAFQELGQAVGYAGSISKKKETFRENRFTGEQGLPESFEVASGPAVMLVANTKDRNEWSALDENGCSHSA